MMNKCPSSRTSGEKYKTKSELHGHVRQMMVLERLCSRFPLVVDQLRSRYENRDTLHVEDEYDVRDLMHVLLTLEYDDIRPEEWTPSYANGISRADFLLKLERIVVMAKMTHNELGAKELGDQLAVDIQRYKLHPECKTLVCFVYDPEGLIANPHGIENELSGEKDELTMRVIIASK